MTPDDAMVFLQVASSLGVGVVFLSLAVVIHLIARRSGVPKHPAAIPTVRRLAVAFCGVAAMLSFLMVIAWGTLAEVYFWLTTALKVVLVGVGAAFLYHLRARAVALATLLRRIADIADGGRL